MNEKTKSTTTGNTIIDALAKIMSRFSKSLLTDMRTIIREELEYALAQERTTAPSRNSKVPPKLAKNPLFNSIELDDDFLEEDEEAEAMYKGKDATQIMQEIKSRGRQSSSYRINPNEVLNESEYSNEPIVPKNKLADELFANATLASDSGEAERPIKRNHAVESKILRNYENLI